MEAIAKVQQYHPMHICIPKTPKKHPQQPVVERTSRLHNLLHSLFDSYQVGTNTSSPTQAQLRPQTTVAADEQQHTTQRTPSMCLF
jgi:hypothetical protein